MTRELLNKALPMAYWPVQREFMYSKERVMNYFNERLLGVN